MNYNFNKKLVEQLRNGEICAYFNREKDSLEMLQALCKEVWPKDDMQIVFNLKYYWTNLYTKPLTWNASNSIWHPDVTSIPLSDFVQPEQSERDVMAELDEKLKRLEDILLRDNEPCKAEPEIVNPVRWRTEKGGLFYFVDYMLDINTMPEDFSHYTTVLYNSGNYYKTKEQAEEMAVLMQFTLNNPELVKQLINKKE